MYMAIIDPDSEPVMLMRLALCSCTLLQLSTALLQEAHLVYAQLYIASCVCSKCNDPGVPVRICCEIGTSKCSCLSYIQGHLFPKIFLISGQACCCVHPIVFQVVHVQQYMPLKFNVCAVVCRPLSQQWSSNKCCTLAGTGRELGSQLEWYLN